MILQFRFKIVRYMLVKKKYLTPHLFLCMISKRVMSMDKILEQTLLYDFYGELLTENQKQVYEDVVLNDYSLSEVAEEQGISRQGVHDLIKRCSKILQDYESKLHLVEKFVTVKEQIERMEASLLETEQPDREELVHQLHGILENL